MNGNNRKDAPISNLTQISEMASEAIKEVREIAYNLGPYQLERLGLKKSVEEMVEKVASTSPIRFEVEIDEIDGRFTRQAEINIFRIIQEAANNIVKHSEASQAKVSVKTDASKATLIIQDNGKGFSAQESSNGNGRHGFGLLGMSERVHLLKGEYKIESEPGKGTTIIVYLAYEQSASQF
jgi:signal transduction histidine kinase